MKAKTTYVFKNYLLNTIISILIPCIQFFGQFGISELGNELFYIVRALGILLLVNVMHFITIIDVKGHGKKVLSFFGIVVPALVLFLYNRSVNDYMPDFLYLFVASICNLALCIIFFIRDANIINLNIKK